MEFFVISMLNGLSYGLLLFMLSSGLTLIFSMMGVLNFAHASFYMLGAYVGFTIASFTGFWWALVLALPLLVLKSGPALMPVSVTLLLISRSSGSISHWPARPGAALVCTASGRASIQPPDVSMKPPLPPWAPPRALKLP